MLGFTADQIHHFLWSRCPQNRQKAMQPVRTRASAVAGTVQSPHQPFVNSEPKRIDLFGLVEVLYSLKEGVRKDRRLALHHQDLMAISCNLFMLGVERLCDLHLLQGRLALLSPQLLAWLLTLCISSPVTWKAAIKTRMTIRLLLQVHLGGR